MRTFLLVAVVSLFSACGPSDPEEVVTHFCEGELRMGNGLSVYAIHAAYVYPDGSALTTCSIAGGRYQTGATYLHRAEDAGVSASRCLTVFDAEGEANAGGFAFGMEAGRTQTRVTYNDPGAPNDRGVWVIPCQQP